MAVAADIRLKFRLLTVLILFATVSLFLLLLGQSLRHILPPAILSPSQVVVIACILLLISFAGLTMSTVLSRMTLRILEDYGSRLARMLNITKDLREEVHSDILLEKVMDHAMALTQSEAGSILLFEDNHRLTFRIVRGEKSGELLGTSIEAGIGITGWVAENGTPVRIADVTKDSRFNPEIDAKTGFTTKTMLCAPLRTREGVLGVLELMNIKGGHPYRDRDEEIISCLAEQAAISIIKTKFYEDQKNYEIHLTEMLLEAIDYQIAEKRGHSRRVARYSNIIATALGMSEEQKKKLYFASLLHDVGFLKMDIEEAYSKDVFMQHPVIGYEMIKPVNFYADIAPLILHHHERYDGHGYPAQLKGDEIPLGARIIAIAESFDAMVSSLSYKVPVGFEEAVTELRRKAGSQFDPVLVDVFVGNVTIEHAR